MPYATADVYSTCGRVGSLLHAFKAVVETATTSHTPISLLLKDSITPGQITNTRHKRAHLKIKRVQGHSFGAGLCTPALSFMR